MAEVKSFSGLNRQEIVIPAYSMHSVFFDTVNPNYYRVHNQGDATLFCATSHQPTESQFDFAVPPESMKIYTEPFERNVLFIFNPSGNAIPITLLTFRAAFDPIALALSDLSLDLSGVNLETATTIDSFNTPLPAGTNKIGSVDVVNAKDYTSVLNYIENHLSTIKNGQASVVSSVQAFNGVAISETQEINASGLCTVHFLTNDGDGQMTVYFGGIPVLLKAGETIQDFRFNGSISVGGTNYSYRAMVTKG